MRILLLAHSFNSLTQRLWVELTNHGHAVSLEFDVNDAVTTQAVALARPDLIIAPFLKRAIPEGVWRNHTCLVVHPGPIGDRGPSALDWAILEGEQSWGVTVLQAVSEMDAGPVWAQRTFTMREATKSSIYRNEVTEAAVSAVLDAVEHSPVPELPRRSWWKPQMRQKDRAIAWDRDDSATILRKIRASDGTPGVLDDGLYLHDAHPSEGLDGAPGSWIARRGHQLARATTDGAVWIGHLGANGLKLPAASVLPEIAATLPAMPGHHDIWYDEKGAVGFLHFPFHNGAMSTDQCRRLEAAFHDATRRPTKVIALMGGPDFWSNGIHLSTIEAAASPADESWANINAMNDLCRAVITCTSHLTVAAMQGNGGAGGVFMALAADLVWARSGVVLNPHYKGMGNLYGSEYWTYLLPRRCGEESARQVTQARLPVGTAEALRLGLIDECFGTCPSAFRAEAEARAHALAADPDIDARIAAKGLARLADEAEKPLETYRAEELARMNLNFYGFDPSYHVARYNFIRKVPKSRTPIYLARHRGKC
ncbi:Hydrogenase maturation factor HoxX [Magnetospirillum sp. LM-5]|uniref:enoyl-CoA hydratase-related protein n=1 Tax=Magnetospirillum sp. LM-5 TaxID=2681466 RepID=UPI0013852ED7|nr:enoyl-CoA hydratase-related protein [Magnetospirillum sp. LM-5]CAA7612790.1 Hydrogenase maturation factor HoxX [Magnetospirillum sp. LM-5]